MKAYKTRSGFDRRQRDLGRPGKLPERRRIPERRLPELTDVSDISFEEFQSLLAALGKATTDRSFPPRSK